MTLNAEIFREGHAHRVGDVRVVLNVAAGAVTRVQYFDQIGIARVGELRLRVRIECGFQLVAVAIGAGILQHFVSAQRRSVAGITGQLDLVVAMGGLPRHKHLLFAWRGQPERQQPGGTEHESEPENPQPGFHQNQYTFNT